MQEHKNSHTIVGTVSDVYQLKELKSSRVKEFRVYTEVGKSKTWHKVKAWNDAADVADLFGEGDLVGIKGMVTTRSYEKDGRKVYVTETVCNEANELKCIEQAQQSVDDDW